MVQRPNIPSFITTSRLRLRDYDYGQPATYFITCTTVDRAPIFGHVRDSGFRASFLGKAILEEWASLETMVSDVILDSCQLMPDHFHGILTILPSDAPEPPTLSAIVGRFKSLSTRRYWKIRDDGLCPNIGTTCWQDRLHDTIIRNDAHYERTLMYICLNPRRWTQKYGY